MKLEINKSSTNFIYGITDADQLVKWCEKNTHYVGMAFVGRSNVGKSSLINALFGKRVARVSNTPGRTRAINIFSFELAGYRESEQGVPPLFLFDLPGYGYAKVSKEESKNWGRLMETFFSYTCNAVTMVNLQDARHPNQQSDLAFQEYIERFNPKTFLVLNKIDKLKKQKERAALESKFAKILAESKWAERVFLTSATGKTGVSALEESIVSEILSRFTAS